MNAELVESFKERVRLGLKTLDDQIVAQLEQLISQTYPSEVFALSFVVFGDYFTWRFPARVFFMDRNNGEHFTFVDRVAQYPSSVDPELTKSCDGIYPAEIEDALMTTNPAADAWAIAEGEFIDWFRARWCDAGGKNFQLVATIGGHDSDTEFDLINDRWQPTNASFATP